MRPRRLVLLGHPVAHSLSPAMQNAALAAANILLVYEALDVLPENLATTLDSLASAGAAGNVTVPHKELVRKLLTHVTPVADRIGAVNTFGTLDDGTLEGDNTDAAGFTALVLSALGKIPAGARVAIIGAGGAAAAALAAIEEWEDAEAMVYARNLRRAEILASRFPGVAGVETLTDTTRLESTIVVNATPVGLNDDAFPVPLESLRPDAAVVDLVYRRNETAWVRAALASGRIARDGLPMLLEQGALAFQRWFGIEPDREAMWRALKEATGRV